MDKHAERVERNDALSTGTLAPAFELRSTPDQSVRLGDFSGRRLIMAFYPADWSPVCTDQMALYNEILPEFQELGAALVGISIDHAWCHAAFAQSRNLHFPLLESSWRGSSNGSASARSVSVPSGHCPSSSASPRRDACTRNGSRTGKSSASVIRHA